MPAVAGNNALALIHSDPEMKRILDLAAKVAASDANVLITGESGTGKSLLAQTIHRQSPRSAGPFVTASCANISEELLESDLFGHERGAFTGAESRRIGKFEQAQGGTLFLAEVSELSPRLQGKLLRVVQERSFERLSGDEKIRVDLRLVASSGADLETASRGKVSQGSLLPAERDRQSGSGPAGKARRHLLAEPSGHSDDTPGPFEIQGGTRELLWYHPWPKCS
jgi:DNA-binding NtrC family response regulator